MKAVGARGKTHIFFKAFCKIGAAFKAAQGSDPSDTAFVFCQKKLRCFATREIDVRNKGISREFVKFMREVVLIDANKLRHVVKRAAFLVGCANIVDGLLGVQNATIMAVMAIVLLRGVAVMLAKQQQKL